jgi:acetylornithine deacetylase/succinyl-diaminopimelate desuccinylase-like protein
MVHRFLLCATLILLPASPSRAQTIEERYRDEVRSLVVESSVADALARVEALDAWTMERLVELTEIPAPPFMEEARARRFAELLAEVGADSVWIDGEGNAIGLLRGQGGGRTIAIGGHLDTVFPQGTDVTVRMRGDTLYAPGVGDDTRGLVVVLTALRAMVEAGVRTRDDVLFVGVVGEEGPGDLRGMKHLFREGAPTVLDAWIEIDGGGFDRLVTQGLGSVRYRVTFQGPGGHSWGAFGLANPAHALGQAVRYFQEAADTLTRSGPRTSYNVGRIGGGTSVNSIPFEAWMEVDMRSHSPESLVADKIGDRPSGELEPTLPLIQRAMAATEQYGGEPSLSRSSTDSNIPIALGIPAVTLGRGGDGDGGHSPGEWWLNRDGHLAIQRALLVVVAEAGLAGLVP